MKIASNYRLVVGTAVLLLLTAGINGCKDFLSENAVPQGTLDAGTLANAAGVEGTLIGAYRTIDCTNNTSAWGCAASNWVWGSVAADDSYKGSTNTDQPPINDIEGRHWGAPDGQDYINAKWQIVYEGISRANATIRLLKSVLASKPSELSDADAKSIEGEAIFLRAYYHFEAYRMWGNVPYYREDDTDFRKPNETQAEVVADLIKDLDAAAALLPPTPRDKGRAGAWTAKAYKGRVQVYAGQFAAAVTTLSDVKANGPYKLETSMDHVWTGFRNLYDGPETIFAYQASSNDGEPNGNNANFGERLNFPYSGSHFGCCGFNQPSQNLVNAYKVDAAGLPLLLSAPTTWNASNAQFVAGNMTPVDPRLDWTVGRNGVPYKDWGLVKVTNGSDSWVRDISNGGPYSPKKNAHEFASGAEQSAGGWAPTQQNSVHIHLFRFADLLLLLAEAQVETGDLAGAMANVNLVRVRAAASAQGCGFRPPDPSIGAQVQVAYPQCNGDARIAVPITDPSITWATYRVSPYTVFPDAAYAREAVRTERRLELAMEGQRFFDLRRWGLAYAAAQMNGYIKGEGGRAEPAFVAYKSSAEDFTQRHLLYPIPNLQVSLSTVNGDQKLKQNPGW